MNVCGANYGQHTAASFAYMLEYIAEDYMYQFSFIPLFSFLISSILCSYFLLFFGKYTAQHKNYNVS